MKNNNKKTTEVNKNSDLKNEEVVKEKNNNNNIEVKLSLNKKGQIVPNFPEGFNSNQPMKQIQIFKVRKGTKEETMKIAYSEQSPKKSLEAYKTGQKGGSPSIRTIGMHEEIKKSLEKGNKVIVEIASVEKGKTPKEQANEELKKYKETNGKYPDWNKQKNKDKWNKK
ncbi:hypothetical protein NYG88_03135 [Campylobacter felis]|uniref:hypothetical protein n=1 Tax=Campylobacter felis TaxID=2974565 RepID=UPI00256042CA|nr:hypothetical protein [Campylobacter felis]